MHSVAISTFCERARLGVTIYCYVSGALRRQLHYFAMWGIALFTVFVHEGHVEPVILIVLAGFRGGLTVLVCNQGLVSIKLVSDAQSLLESFLVYIGENWDVNVMFEKVNDNSQYGVTKSLRPLC